MILGQKEARYEWFCELGFILTAFQLLDKTGRRLGVTMSIANETEEIGLATLGRLHEDRAKLEGSPNTVLNSSLFRCLGYDRQHWV